MGLLASRVDLLPILLRADDGPPTLWTFIQPLFELADVGFAIVGKLTFTIVMMDQKSEAGAFAARGPFQQQVHGKARRLALAW